MLEGACFVEVLERGSGVKGRNFASARVPESEVWSQDSTVMIVALTFIRASSHCGPRVSSEKEGEGWLSASRPGSRSLTVPVTPSSTDFFCIILPYLVL
jgi:hypothetical protein